MTTLQKAHHTPGPWSAPLTYGASKFEIQGQRGPTWKAVAVVDRIEDAHLIAAAPRLLAALRSLQANPNDPRAHRGALDAIAEATEVQQ